MARPVTATAIHRTCFNLQVRNAAILPARICNGHSFTVTSMGVPVRDGCEPVGPRGLVFSRRQDEAIRQTCG